MACYTLTCYRQAPASIVHCAGLAEPITHHDTLAHDIFWPTHLDGQINAYRMSLLVVMPHSHLQGLCLAGPCAGKIYWTGLLPSFCFQKFQAMPLHLASCAVLTHLQPCQLSKCFQTALMLQPVQAQQGLAHCAMRYTQAVLKRPAAVPCVQTCPRSPHALLQQALLDVQAHTQLLLQAVAYPTPIVGISCACPEVPPLCDSRTAISPGPVCSCSPHRAATARPARRLSPQGPAPAEREPRPDAAPGPSSGA